MKNEGKKRESFNTQRRDENSRSNGFERCRRKNRYESRTVLGYCTKPLVKAGITICRDPETPCTIVERTKVIDAVR